MSLTSEHDGERRPGFLGRLFGLLSLLLGAAVVIGCAELIYEAFKWWRAPVRYVGGEHGGGYANDPLSYFCSQQGGCGPFVLVGGIALLGCVFACIALRKPPRRWGVCGLALNAGCPLFCYASYLIINPFLSPPPPPPIPRVPPSAFFGWCRDNNFGARCPVVSSKCETNTDQDHWLSRPDVIGEAELSITTPCNTDEEAKAFVEAAIAELKAVAQERGISLSVDHTYADPPGQRMGNGGWERIVETTCMYRAEPITGSLNVSAEWHLIGANGKPKPQKEYTVQFSLFEKYSR